MMRLIASGLIAAILLPMLLWVQEPERKIVRAKRPQFDQRDGDIFFKNIFDEALVGDRPENFGQMAAMVASTSNGDDNSEATPESSRKWSELISATTIHDEVKKIKIHLDQTITTPNKFASGGSKDARVDFTVLAMLFAVISDYDTDDVKWKKDAAAARDAFARCAANASTSDERAYQQSKLRREDLGEILNGGSVALDPPEEVANDWSKISDRSPLMERLEHSYSEVIKRATASEAEFSSRKEELMHEASLVAVMAEVLMMEGMEDAIEDDYVAYAVEMKKGAVDLMEAIKLENVEMAETAAGVIDQSCSRCHEDWQ